MWTIPEHKGMARTTSVEAEELKLASEGCGLKSVCISKFLLLLQCYNEPANVITLVSTLNSSLDFCSYSSRKSIFHLKTFLARFSRLVMLYSK